MFVLVCGLLLAQSTITVPPGNTDVKTLVDRITALEAEVNALQEAEPTEPAMIAGVYDNLLIKGTSAPGLLRIGDNFGKETLIFSIGGDLAIKNYANPAMAITSSIRFQDNAGADVHTFYQDGRIKFSKRPTAIWSSISTTRTYFLPIINDVGDQSFIQVRGGWLRAHLINSN